MTLWDLISRPLRRKRKPPPAPSPAPRTAPARKAGPAQQRYDRLVAEMKQAHRVRVVRWRRSMSGCAGVVQYEDGVTANLIESPYPKGPVSCAIFLHEIGHHAIGFTRYKPRCLEEHKAWQWALQTMRDRGLNITRRVEQRIEESVRWSVRAALRRGLKRLPEELIGHLPEGWCVVNGKIMGPRTAKPTPVQPSAVDTDEARQDLRQLIAKTI